MVTIELKNQAIPYNTGASLRLNRVNGSPEVGMGNTYIVSLRDQRTGAKSAANIISAPGEEIGLARVYDFALESGSYSTVNSDINEWDISLYDIQTFTKIHADIGQSYEKVGWTSNTYFDGCVFGYCEPVNVVNSASYSNSDGIAYTMMGIYEEHIGDTVIVYCGYYNMETQYLDSIKIIID